MSEREKQDREDDEREDERPDRATLVRRFIARRGGKRVEVSGSPARETR